MSKGSPDHVKRVAEYIQQHKPSDGDISLKEVMALAETMTDSYKEVFEKINTVVYKDLTAIATAIEEMRDEISSLRAEDIKHNRIPEAGKELDAIVASTEQATHSIMEAAEAIMAADQSDPEAFQEIVNDRVVEIFEACAFQDITGQRISKVVSTLSFIETRVSSFIDRLKLVGEDAAHEETAEERRRRELILHGPQHAGEGVDQSDIDRMLAEDGDEADDTGSSSQNDIDKLFD
ncbi:protein phosphatase CheZ [Rhodobium gokarnense]|uniref:Chemotaxis protein CheZ n=1 Tax=Rhodobium gokarnense TaxID=364296 RepID=A0ABT3HCS7_9HYPH|nr:protein phosphatase CheZ [Rhodobium gokarnense]MCW2308159.1 chemotaxis protein CheZ [Rhodobium gokarnense]